jgi:hypothetical protein
MQLRRQTLFCEHIRSARCGFDDVGSTWSISVCVPPDWSYATEVSAWECSPVWGGSTVPSLPSDDSDTQREGKDMAITDLIAIPKDLNPGVSSAKQITMLTLLGNPRGTYDQTCRPIQNPALLPLIVTETVGPLRVTGLRPAIESFRKTWAALGV